MRSTNGHGPRMAILYARVSTEEHYRSGNSFDQQLVYGAWKEERIGAGGTLMRTARGCATLPLAPTLDALHDATRMSRSKPPTRWVYTRSSGCWKRST